MISSALVSLLPDSSPKTFYSIKILINLALLCLSAHLKSIVLLRSLLRNAPQINFPQDLLLGHYFLFRF